MLAHLLATIEQLTLGTPHPGLASHPTDRLVYYAGHDINIYFLRNFLRLNWITQSWNQNQAMPGGMLAFEILTAGTADAGAEAYFVKVYFVSQSYQQMRNAEPLTSPADGPSRVFVTIPECAFGPEESCPVADFRALVLRVVRAECVSTVRADQL